MPNPDIEQTIQRILASPELKEIVDRLGVEKGSPDEIWIQDAIGKKVRSIQQSADEHGFKITFDPFEISCSLGQISLFATIIPEK